MTDITLQAAGVPRDLLWQSDDVLAAPHAAQQVQAGATSYSSYALALAHDLARGLSQSEWARELAQEGDSVLARRLALGCNSPDLDLFLKQQQDAWHMRLHEELRQAEEQLKLLPTPPGAEDQQALGQMRKEAESQMSQGAYHLARQIVQSYRDEVEQVRERAAQQQQQRRKLALDRVRQAREAYYASVASQENSDMLEQAQRLLDAADRIVRAGLNEGDMIRLEHYCDAATQLCQGPTSSAARQLMEELSAAPAQRPEKSPAWGGSSHPSESLPNLPRPAGGWASAEVIADLSAQFPAPVGGWTAQQDTALVESYLAYSDEELANHLGLSPEAVQARIQTLGLVGARTSSVRAPRGRELRQESWPNPYLPGKPIMSPKMFFGRERDLEYLRSNLSHAWGEGQGRVVILEGHRRTGKTSLLRHLEGQKTAPSILAPRIPVYLPIDLYIPFTSARLFQKMSDTIYRALHHLNLPVDQPVLADFQSDFGLAWHRYLEQAEEATGGRGLVLMFDEFQIIEERRAAGDLDKDVYWVLRADIQKARQIDFILAGTMRLEEIVRQHDAALFNIGPVHVLRSLDEHTAQQLIREPVRDQKLTYDDEAVELILALTSSYPYYVQLLCSVLFNYLHDYQKRRVMRADVERIVPKVLEDGTTQFTSMLSAKDVSLLERSILAGAAEQITTLGGACSRAGLFALLSEKKLVSSEADFERGLRQLVFRDVLKDAGGEHLGFQVDLFRQWLTAQKRLDRVIREERDQARRG
jgi:biotin operon repressor